MLVTKKRVRGAKPTPEQIAMIEAAKKLPIVYDEDCPKLTEEELRQFERVNPRSNSVRFAKAACTARVDSTALHSSKQQGSNS